ncbi:MAG TPA: TlpA disulfide reductase family protein [Bryobacteraceae bacterium]|nr:TlpA disulfide reductase family protein [Bryobacteraceae bacterium]
MRSLLALGLVAASLATAAQIPRPAGPLSFTTPAGQNINLADYKGKVVVVEILSTTCPHCQSSARTLSRIRKSVGTRDFEVLGMAINPDANIPDFIRNFSVDFPVGQGKRDDAYSFLQISVMSPFYFPQMVFIDRQGNIRAQYGGTDSFFQGNEEANIRGQVDRLLKEPGAKPVQRSSKKAS